MDKIIKKEKDRRAEKWNKILKSISMLYLHGYINDTQRDKMMAKLEKDMGM